MILFEAWPPAHPLDPNLCGQARKVATVILTNVSQLAEWSSELFSRDHSLLLFLLLHFNFARLAAKRRSSRRRAAAIQTSRK